MKTLCQKYLQIYISLASPRNCLQITKRVFLIISNIKLKILENNIDRKTNDCNYLKSIFLYLIYNSKNSLKH